MIPVIAGSSADELLQSSDGQSISEVEESQISSANNEALEPLSAIDAGIPIVTPIESENVEVSANPSEENGNVPTPSVTASVDLPGSSQKGSLQVILRYFMKLCQLDDNNEPPTLTFSETWKNSK